MHRTATGVLESHARRQKMDRRSILSGAAAAAGTALAGCAGTPAASAAGGGRMAFAVPVTTIPVVAASEVVPVRRIYCIGRNSGPPPREMGSAPTREPPFFFQKPTDAIQYVPT